ncbi:MAG: DUF1080 domain-containing protein [Balneolaceae bacterium]|nr:DUF1080 domain-containing protein [Balneolaceae bacterium]MBO6547372.1 DUF1080 domain-containing protein [Balneolaceae bacterium]MBO6647681.1 DUF1080 domain-containing protein [Balneolaceae bacterium]
MKKLPFTFRLSLIPLIIISCSQAQKETPILTDGEWISLFDGETFDGWKEYNSDTINPKWQIEDGAIIVSKEGNTREKNTGFGKSIMTVEQFGNFELELEYKMSEGGNSGIMYHVVEDPKYGQDYETAPEYQVLDDEFSATETEPIRMAASSYDMFIPDPEKKKLNPAGEWNKVRLVYDNGRVEHWLNGLKVLEFTEGSHEWEEAYANSKFSRDFPDWGKSNTGHISLQDHGDYVAFRNIRIREL